MNIIDEVLKGRPASEVIGTATQKRAPASLTLMERPIRKSSDVLPAALPAGTEAAIAKALGAALTAVVAKAIAQQPAPRPAPAPAPPADLTEPVGADMFKRMSGDRQQAAVDELIGSFVQRGKVMKRQPSALLAEAMNEVIGTIMKNDRVPRSVATLKAIELQPLLYRAQQQEHRLLVSNIGDYE